MPDSEHVLRLKQIRDERTAERRDTVAEYREASNPLDAVAKIILIQAEIDAIDRAITDEERLAKS